MPGPVTPGALLTTPEFKVMPSIESGIRFVFLCMPLQVCIVDELLDSLKVHKREKNAKHAMSPKKPLRLNLFLKMEP